MFAMNITAVSLVLTVAILNLHNNPSLKKPPVCMKFIAFNVLSKVLCVDVSYRHKYDSDDTESPDFNPSVVSEQNEWILLGRVFDRLCLYIFAIVHITAFIFPLLFYSGSKLPHPKHLPREETSWTI